MLLHNLKPYNTLSIFEDHYSDEDETNIFNYSLDDNSTHLDYEYENYQHEIIERGWAWALALHVFYSLVSILGFAGNTLVIYVILRFSKIPTVTNFYLVNLAIADLLFLIGVPFVVATMNLGYWPFGEIVCKVYYYFTSINQISSSMFLLVMSADRYLAVCHPIRSVEWRTPLISKLVAFVAWTLSALLTYPIFLYANILEIQSKPNCNIFWPEYLEISGSKIFVFYTFFLGFCLPFTLIFVFYVLIIFRIWTTAAANSTNVGTGVGVGVGGQKSSNRSTKGEKITSLNNESFSSNSDRARERHKSRLKVTKLVLAIVTVYFVCWFPFWVMQIALVLPVDTNYQPPQSHAKQIVFLLTSCLSYSNSALNPILYSFLSHNFKISFLKAWPLLFKKRQNNGNEPPRRLTRINVPCEEVSKLTDETVIPGGIKCTCL